MKLPAVAFATACASVVASSPAAIAAQESAPLSLEAKIPLGTVDGRIDHLAIDLDRRLLFVAELGNGSVGVVNIESRKVVRNLTGFDEPQGVAYDKTTESCTSRAAATVLANVPRSSAYARRHDQAGSRRRQCRLDADRRRRTSVR